MIMKKITIYLYETELPEDIEGVTSPNKGQENSYTIMIDSKQTETGRAAAFLHEMLHVYRDDFNSGKTVQQIETETEELMRMIAYENL